MHIVFPLPGGSEALSAELALAPLGQIFDSTTTSYKYWWFAALLQLHRSAMIELKSKHLLQPAGKLHPLGSDAATAAPAETLTLRHGHTQLLTKLTQAPLPAIPFWQLAALMTAKAWYPRCYFRLRFGSADQIPPLLDALAQKLPLNQAGSEEAIYTLLCQAAISDDKIKEQLLELTVHVPYRLLSPWISYKSDGQVIAQSALEPQALYQIEGSRRGERAVRIHPLWQEYLFENYAVLQNFTDLALAKYLEKRNPNVPNIINKLHPQHNRAPLSYAKKYFDVYLSQYPAACCIYTQQPLPQAYALDHFIPWSFVAHDELWNLAPIDQSSNSSKSDKLPDLARFLPRLAQLQQEALRANLPKLKTCSQGYLVKARDSLTDGLGKSIDELAAMSLSQFKDCLEQVIYPLYLQAQSLNFQPWSGPAAAPLKSACSDYP